MEEDEGNQVTTFLEQLDPADFARVLLRVPSANQHLSKETSHYQQVAAFMVFVRSITGPGEKHLLTILVNLFPNFLPFRPNTPLSNSSIDVAKLLTPRHSRNLTYNSLFEIREREDGGFIIQHGSHKEYGLPGYLPCLSINNELVSHEYLEFWDKIYAHINSLLEHNYIEKANKLTMCTFHWANKDINLAEGCAREVSNFLDGLMGLRKKYDEDVQLFPSKFRNTEPIDTLSSIPVCLSALQRSLASPPGTDQFTIGIELGRAIGDWLLHGRCIAKSVLDSHLRDYPDA